MHHSKSILHTEGPTDVRFVNTSLIPDSLGSNKTADLGLCDQAVCHCWHNAMLSDRHWPSLWTAERHAPIVKN